MWTPPAAPCPPITGKRFATYHQNCTSLPLCQLTTQYHPDSDVTQDVMMIAHSTPVTSHAPHYQVQPHQPAPNHSGWHHLPASHHSGQSLQPLTWIKSVRNDESINIQPLVASLSGLHHNEWGLHWPGNTSKRRIDLMNYSKRPMIWTCCFKGL